jgi:hypothetical protein
MPRRARKRATNETREPVNTYTTIVSMQHADLAKLIVDQIADSLPIIASQLKADTLDQGNNDGSGGASGADSGFIGESGAWCTYMSFLSCRPPSFKATIGATSVIQLMESIEPVTR